MIRTTPAGIASYGLILAMALGGCGAARTTAQTSSPSTTESRVDPIAKRLRAVSEAFPSDSQLGLLSTDHPRRVQPVEVSPLQAVLNEVDRNSPLLRNGSQLLREMNANARRSLLSLLKYPKPISVFVYDGCPTKNDYPECVYIWAPANDRHKDPTIGSGIYLGGNRVLTAHHVFRNRHFSEFTVKQCNQASEENVPISAIDRVDESQRHVDLAIVYLKTNLRGNAIPFATREQIDSIAIATVVGFGSDDRDGRHGGGIKRRATVAARGCDNACPCESDRHILSLGGVLSLADGCSGARADTCQGDSGGPIYISLADGQRVIAGMTLKGCHELSKCGDGGIYLRGDLISNLLAP